MSYASEALATTAHDLAYASYKVEHIGLFGENEKYWSISTRMSDIIDNGDSTWGFTSKEVPEIVEVPQE